MTTLGTEWRGLQNGIPELLLAATMVALLAASVLEGVRRNATCQIIAFVGTALAAAALVEHAATLVSGPRPATSLLFTHLVFVDPFALAIQLIVLLFTLLIIVLHALLPPEPPRDDAPEFFVLLLAAALGLCAMVGTDNLLMLFTAMTVAALPSHILAASTRSPGLRRSGAGGALKFALFGAVSTGIMLYGISLLYGLSGSLEIPRVAAACASASGPTRAAAVVGMLALLTGIGFQCALAPAHLWFPDALEGSHMDVAAFFSVASIGAALAVLLRVAHAFVAAGGYPGEMLPWLIAGAGTATCTWANLAAYGQTNIKRLLAYSSVAHAGYMTLGIALLALGSGRGAMPAADALLFYLAMYMLMNGGAFVAAAAVGCATGSESIDAFRGLGRRAPLIAFSMSVFLLALAGIPLTIGFAARLRLFQALFAARDGIGYLGIAVLAVNTILAAGYYFRVLRIMYFTEIEAPALVEWTPITLLSLLLVVPAVALFVPYGPETAFAQSFAQIRGQTRAAAPRITRRMRP